MPKKTNYVEVAAGAALIIASIVDIIPGDEPILIPMGLGLIAQGFGYI